MTAWQRASARLIHWLAARPQRISNALPATGLHSGLRSTARAGLLQGACGLNYDALARSPPSYNTRACGHGQSHLCGPWSPAYALLSANSSLSGIPSSVPSLDGMGLRHRYYASSAASTDQSQQQCATTPSSATGSDSASKPEGSGSHQVEESSDKGEDAAEPQRTDSQADQGPSAEQLAADLAAKAQALDDATQQVLQMAPCSFKDALDCKSM
jgi:hypothetical protein